MGYTELGRKRPIVIQGDIYDEILIYKYKGEVWGVCYKGGEIDCVYNYTKKEFHWIRIHGMTLKEIVKTDSGIMGFNAEMTLDEFKKGNI